MRFDLLQNLRNPLLALLQYCSLCYAVFAKGWLGLSPGNAPTPVLLRLRLPPGNHSVLIQRGSSHCSVVELRRSLF